jgi:hypothetical protein
MVRTKQTKAKKVNKKNAEREASSKGANLLTCLADENLKEASRDVLTILMENALDGNVSSVQYLVELTERAERAKKPEEAGSGISQADLWWEEPEWPGESSEAMAEMAAGSREPEG